MTARRDVEIKFEQLDVDHGGRAHPLVTDSRPQFFYFGHDWDCRVEIIAPGPRNPLIGVRAYLVFTSPADHVGRLQVGSPFLFREWKRTIGFGVVARLLELERSAEVQRADRRYNRSIRRVRGQMQRMDRTIGLPSGGEKVKTVSRDELNASLERVQSTLRAELSDPASPSVLPRPE